MNRETEGGCPKVGNRSLYKRENEHLGIGDIGELG
jgi:hypothetical protein